MKLFLPKQHGAWAMLLIPYWLGVIASGFVWQHIPFFIGWLLLYLATYPLLLLFKGKKIPFYAKWACIYFIPAILLLLVPLFTRPTIVWFGIAMVPFFCLNAYFSKRNQDRAFLNDLSAILVFGISGLASSYLPTGEVSSKSILIFIASTLFFVGSTFYVKTMIREKKSQTYKKLSWVYHILVVIGWVVVGQWLVAIANLASLGRAIYFYGKPYSVKKVGILEIVNATIFFLIMAVAIIL